MPEILAYRDLAPEQLTAPYTVAYVQHEDGKLFTSRMGGDGQWSADTQLSIGSLNYDPDSVVNMPFRGVGADGANPQGWLRDQEYFARALYQQKPEAFSPQNIARMENGEALVIDRRMSDVFPQYKGFEGEKVNHHHIGGDGQAVGLPHSLHIGYGGVHNAERDRGVRTDAERFSDFYAKTAAEHPEMSREAISDAYRESVYRTAPEAAAGAAVPSAMQAPQAAGAASDVTGDFSKGASYVISKENYDARVAGNHNEFLGRDGSLFVTPKEEMDQLLAESGNDPRLVEKGLGLPENALGNGDYMRVDIPNAENYDISLPHANTPGANENFVEGGKTSGGVHEAVMRGVPTPENDPNATVSSVVHAPVHEKADSKEDSEEHAPPAAEAGVSGEEAEAARAEAEQEAGKKAETEAAKAEDAHAEEEKAAEKSEENAADKSAGEDDVLAQNAKSEPEKAADKSEENAADKSAGEDDVLAQNAKSEPEKAADKSEENAADKSAGEDDVLAQNGQPEPQKASEAPQNANENAASDDEILSQNSGKAEPARESTPAPESSPNQEQSAPSGHSEAPAPDNSGHSAGQNAPDPSGPSDDMGIE